MMFLWIPFLLIPLAFFWMRPGMGMWGCAMDHAGHSHAPAASAPDAIEIARQRLARGEVNVAEFDVIKRVLG